MTNRPQPRINRPLPNHQQLLLNRFNQQLKRQEELAAKERYIKARVSSHLQTYEGSEAYEAYQNESSFLLGRLLRSKALGLHWSHQEMKSVNNIIYSAFLNAKSNAHRALNAKKLQVLTSFEELQEAGFDPSFNYANSDAEYLNMPADPRKMVQWVTLDEEVRLNSKLDSDFVEFLLSHETLNRQILILSFATNWTTFAMSQLLNVTEATITNRRHQLSRVISALLKSRR